MDNKTAIVVGSVAATAVAVGVGVYLYKNRKAIEPRAEVVGKSNKYASLLDQDGQKAFTAELDERIKTRMATLDAERELAEAQAKADVVLRTQRIEDKARQLVLHPAPAVAPAASGKVDIVTKAS